jgi:putative membrane protein
MSTAVLVAAMTGIATPQAFAGSVSSQDTSFMTSIHQGNLAEIAAGSDAQRHATTGCVKRVGMVLVRDHRELDADLKTLARRLSVNLPASPSTEQTEELAAVQAKGNSAAYDRAWLALQETAHEGALALIDQEIKSGTNPETKAAARAARPVVAMHLELVRGGTCHENHVADTIKAGNGGQLASAATDGAPTTVRTGALLGGGMLTAGGTLWLLRGRRRSAEPR